MIQEKRKTEEKEGSSQLFAPVKLDGQVMVVKPSSYGENHGFAGHENKSEETQEHHGKVKTVPGFYVKVDKQQKADQHGTAAHGGCQQLGKA
jgi:hypothetical protein